MVRPNKHCQWHPMIVCLVCCVKCIDITKITTLGTLASMAPKNIFKSTCSPIYMCIPVKVLIRTLTMLKELQQLWDII
jgi:hypothetical protein